MPLMRHNKDGSWSVVHKLTGKTLMKTKSKAKAQSRVKKGY